MPAHWAKRAWPTDGCWRWGESFLRAGVLEEAKGWRPTESGTPQGGVISPLLANPDLDPLDHQMAAAGWDMAGPPRPRL